MDWAAPPVKKVQYTCTDSHRNIILLYFLLLFKGIGSPYNVSFVSIFGLDMVISTNV